MAAIEIGNIAIAEPRAEFRVQLNENQWLVKGHADVTAAVLKSEFKYKEDKNYVDPSTGQVTDRKRVDGIDNVKAGLAGFGVAFDLGATYQLLPDLKLSAALTDLGFIHWNNALQASTKGEWTFDARKLIGEVGCGMPETLFLALHTVSEHLREIEGGGGTDDEA